MLLFDECVLRRSPSPIVSSSFEIGAEEGAGPVVSSPVVRDMCTDAGLTSRFSFPDFPYVVIIWPYANGHDEGKARWLSRTGA